MIVMVKAKCVCIGLAIYRFKFEPSAILMSFYSVTKFNILSLLKVMNRFTLDFAKKKKIFFSDKAHFENENGETITCNGDM